ncbi:hypothetical protein QVD17_31773 [Tagetes erecta]|uniref:Uncharacterized protein n=1 Tax=Tagetes erecta TaxID=13708 RepID=A0AAD8K415_TARER|nr:hypothetical protein QVD17_31773 [Tagetes erecta]
MCDELRLKPDKNKVEQDGRSKSKSKRPTVKKLVQQLQKALDIQLEQGGSLADIDNFAAHVDEQSSAGILQVSSSRSSSSGSSHASFSHSWKYDVLITSFHLFIEIQSYNVSILIISNRSVDEILKLFEAPDDGIVRNHFIRFLT